MKIESPEQPQTENHPEQEEELLKYEPGVGIRFTELAKDDIAETPEPVENPAFDEMKESLRKHKELSQPVIEEAKKKRNELLEARGIFSMSKADFDADFSSKEFEIRPGLEQQNVGVCYVIAAIHALSRSPHFEIICRSSMKKLPDGSWQVHIPLMSEKGQIITITPEELLPQENPQFQKPDKNRKMAPDLRKTLEPVKGKEGLQVLEAAFIKKKFGSVDRLAAEGGQGEEVLQSFGGDNFMKYRFTSQSWNQEKSKAEYPGLNALSGLSKIYVDDYLENFDPEIHIATAATRFGGDKAIASSWSKKSAEFLTPGHAYSITAVDAEKKKITLANPWDTSKPIKLSFDQFKENFFSFNAIRIDSSRLLKNMRRMEENKAA